MTKKAGEGFLQSAEAVLRRAGKPLTCREIVERAIGNGLLSSSGNTPQNTLSAQLNRHIDKCGDASLFKKVSRGLYQLKGR